MKLDARQIVQVIDRENLRNKIDNRLANGEEKSKDVWETHKVESETVRENINSDMSEMGQEKP